MKYDDFFKDNLYPLHSTYNNNTVTDCTKQACNQLHQSWLWYPCAGVILETCIPFNCYRQLGVTESRRFMQQSRLAFPKQSDILMAILGTNL